MPSSSVSKGLRRLVYASTFSGRPSDLSEVLRVILAMSIQNNRQVAVTGMLVVGDAHFLQLLEGPAASVEEVYGRISDDRRHTALTVLSDQIVEQRLFRDWNMAHHRIGGGDQALLRKFGLAAFTPAELVAEQAVDFITGAKPSA